MSATEKDTLAAAWIALHHSAARSQAHNDNFWAFTTLSDLCESAPEQGWEFIEAIRRADGSDVILANLAAGPLEDLLVRHGPQFIERVEMLAASDPQFRKMLGALWKNSIRDDVWSRIQRVSGPTF
jgi:hypothetical protein